MDYDNIKRYGKLSSGVGIVGIKLLAEKLLGINIDHNLNAEKLQKVLGDLKGPVMKVAQILSMVPDLLPTEYTEKLAILQGNAPPMHWSFVKRRLVAELGPDWRSKFSEFDESASYAASLGQVHKCKNLSGKTLACKIQYPGMESYVEGDLNQLRRLLAIYENYDSAIKTQEIYAELKDRITEELDYYREAENIKIFQKIFDNSNLSERIRVPDVIESLSTGKLITMEWLNGEDIKVIEEKPEEIRNDFASLLFKAWYQPLYHYGVIHADPHMGNYKVNFNDNEPIIEIMDFGCIRIFNPEFIEGVILLYRALQEKDQKKAKTAYELWGFENLNDEIIEVLNIWADFVYKPLMSDEDFAIEQTPFGVMGRTVAMDVYQKIRENGGVKLPRGFVFLDRSALALSAAFLKLKAKVNWHQLFEELIDGFSKDMVIENQKRLNG